MLLYVHKSHARLFRDGEHGGSGSLFVYFYLSSLKTEETVSHCQNNNVNADGDHVGSKHLVYPATCSFNHCAEHSRKDRVRRITC